jgi:hypothetical protein
MSGENVKGRKIKGKRVKEWGGSEKITERERRKAKREGRNITYLAMINGGMSTA